MAPKMLTMTQPLVAVAVDHTRSTVSPASAKLIDVKSCAVVGSAVRSSTTSAAAVVSPPASRRSAPRADRQPGHEPDMSGSERPQDLLEYERGFWGRGHLVAGVDEAGRGPLAGPVVAAAVILPEGVSVEGADDSKQLRSITRPTSATALQAKMRLSM